MVMDYPAIVSKLPGALKATSARVASMLKKIYSPLSKPEI